MPKKRKWWEARALSRARARSASSPYRVRKYKHAASRCCLEAAEVSEPAPRQKNKHAASRYLETAEVLEPVADHEHGRVEAEQNVVHALRREGERPPRTVSVVHPLHTHPDLPSVVNVAPSAGQVWEGSRPPPHAIRGSQRPLPLLPSVGRGVPRCMSIPRPTLCAWTTRRTALTTRRVDDAPGRPRGRRCSSARRRATRASPAARRRRLRNRRSARRRAARARRRAAAARPRSHTPARAGLIGLHTLFC